MGKEKKNTVVVNFKFRCSIDLRDKIKKSAEADDRTQNYMVRKILQQWADREYGKND